MQVRDCVLHASYWNDTDVFFDCKSFIICYLYIKKKWEMASMKLTYLCKHNAQTAK